MKNTLILLSCFTLSLALTVSSAAPPTPAAPTAAPSAKTSAVWGEVESLIQQQKFQAALDKTLAILNAARARNDDKTIIPALIKATQLQLGLHGYEKGVRFLKDEPWPKDPAAK